MQNLLFNERDRNLLEQLPKSSPQSQQELVTLIRRLDSEDLEWGCFAALAELNYFSCRGLSQLIDYPIT